jgi:hypothetical protein
MTFPTEWKNKSRVPNFQTINQIIMFPIKVASWWYTLIHIPHFQRTPGHPVNPKNLGKNVGIPEYHLEIKNYKAIFKHSQQHGIDNDYLVSFLGWFQSIPFVPYPS